MAYTTITGTFSGSSTTPAVDFRTMMSTQFGALGGNWAVVDDAYTNSTSVRTVITNTAGFALMIVTSTTTTNTTANIYLGESYSVATHTLSNIAMNDDVSVTTNSTGFSATNYNPTNIQTTTTPTGHSSYYYYPATSGQTNWIICYDTDYAIVGIKDGSASLGKWFYFGKATSLVENTTLTDSYPFVLAHNWSNNLSLNGALILNSLGNNSVSLKHGGVVIPEANPFLIGAPGTNTYRDKYSLSPTKTTASNIIIVREASDIKGATDPSTYGWKRFKLNNIVYTEDDGSAWGDTTVIDGSTYQYIGGTGDRVGTNTIAGWVKI